MQTRAYSYIRFSTPEQAKGDSLNRQLEASEDYALKNNLSLDTSLRDLGKSAFKSANVKDGKLGEFLACVESGEVPKGSVLIVESLDRLSRDAVLKALPRFMALIESGITVVTLGSSPQKYDSSTIEANPFILVGSLMEMVRANEESKRKSDRVGAAWSRKKREAGQNGIITKRAPAWLEVKNGAFVPVKGRAEIVRRIFKMTIEGYGKGIIAKIFNKTNTPAFGKSGWHASYIQKILTNRSVIGEYLPMTCKEGKRQPDGEPVLNYFPAIITEDIFLAAARSRLRRRKTGGRPSEGSNAIFTGLMKCGHCSGPVVSITKNKTKGWVYYVCDNARRGRGCAYHSWQKEEFEKMVLDWIVDFDFSAKAPNKELSILEEAVNNGEIGIEQTQLKIENLINSLELTKSTSIAARIKDLELAKTKKITELEKTKTAYLELQEKAVILAADQKGFKKAIKDPASRDRLKIELKKRVKNISVIFADDHKEAFPIYEGQPFARVNLFNGVAYDLLKDGEFVIFKEGKRLVSEGLA